MSSIEEYVKRTLALNELEEIAEDSKVAFSLRLDPKDAFRLEYVAKQLGKKRAGLAREFVLLALRDAEKVMGLNYLDIDSSYGREFYEKCCGFHDDEGNKMPPDLWQEYLEEKYADSGQGAQ